MVTFLNQIPSQRRYCIHFSDSIYTERFMGLPNSGDNLSGYTTAQLLRQYDGIRDKEYFLIHGSYDDNVHYQQSMLWARVLERQDILFRQQVSVEHSKKKCI